MPIGKIRTPAEQLRHDLARQRKRLKSAERTRKGTQGRRIIPQQIPDKEREGISAKRGETEKSLGVAGSAARRELAQKNLEAAAAQRKQRPDPDSPQKKAARERERNRPNPLGVTPPKETRKESIERRRKEKSDKRLDRRTKRGLPNTPEEAKQIREDKRAEREAGKQIQQDDRRTAFEAKKQARRDEKEERVRNRPGGPAIISARRDAPRPGKRRPDEGIAAFRERIRREQQQQQQPQVGGTGVQPGQVPPPRPPSRFHGQPGGGPSPVGPGIGAGIGVGAGQSPGQTGVSPTGRRLTAVEQQAARDNEALLTPSDSVGGLATAPANFDVSMTDVGTNLSIDGNTIRVGPGGQQIPTTFNPETNEFEVDKSKSPFFKDIAAATRDVLASIVNDPPGKDLAGASAEVRNLRNRRLDSAVKLITGEAFRGGTTAQKTNALNKIIELMEEVNAALPNSVPTIADRLFSGEDTPILDKIVGHPSIKSFKLIGPDGEEAVFGESDKVLTTGTYTNDDGNVVAVLHGQRVFQRGIEYTVNIDRKTGQVSLDEIKVAKPEKPETGTLADLQLHPLNTTGEINRRGPRFDEDVKRQGDIINATLKTGGARALALAEQLQNAGIQINGEVSKLKRSILGKTSIKDPEEPPTVDVDAMSGQQRSFIFFRMSIQRTLLERAELIENMGGGPDAATVASGAATEAELDAIMAASGISREAAKGIFDATLP